MKRTLWITLAFIMILGLLVACRGNQQTSIIEERDASDAVGTTSSGNESPNIEQEQSTIDNQITESRSAIESPKLVDNAESTGPIKADENSKNIEPKLAEPSNPVKNTEVSEQIVINSPDYGTIEIIGKDGTSQIIELGTLDLVVGYGGVKRSTGTINGPGKITAVSFAALLEVVGGYSADDRIVITATDGYVATLTGKEIAGSVPTYNIEGGPVSAIVQGVIMVESDHEALNNNLPRVAFIGEEPVVTDGFQWVREVAKIEVR
ncbi:hypothetical protein [Desulfuribacillus alkaliarsenatis]|uniref:Oxidoreductase molybdopterin-binding domain-containing protein n=1 Tax=Desulfuribacillus alkaliarsenatis TaxID=766136 RepID=A0A1E5FZA2_9FIRM|nr:hypothetical protein [Desulfuribacillus alkaliarsenatis]OEF95905.1 hypothetical protein BHF68_10970 [Desulfuribacillus alkaliarsenatis]